MNLLFKSIGVLFYLQLISGVLLAVAIVGFRLAGWHFHLMLNKPFEFPVP